METNKDDGFEKNRQGQRTPDADGKVKTPLKPNRKDSYFEAHNEREQAGNANRRQNRQAMPIAARTGRGLAAM
jgi:hypothetical protein